jgi:hypothetical protein
MVRGFSPLKETIMATKIPDGVTVSTRVPTQQQNLQAIDEAESFEESLYYVRREWRRVIRWFQGTLIERGAMEGEPLPITDRDL